MSHEATQPSAKCSPVHTTDEGEYIPRKIEITLGFLYNQGREVGTHMLRDHIVCY